jgi:hypothetical protein
MDFFHVIAIRFPVDFPPLTYLPTFSGTRLAKLKVKQVPTTSRTEADLLNDSLLSNENIVITKKEGSFVLLTKPLPHKPQQVVATLPPSTNVVATRQGNATTYYFKECGKENKPKPIPHSLLEPFHKHTHNSFCFFSSNFGSFFLQLSEFRENRNKRSVWFCWFYSVQFPLRFA